MSGEGFGRREVLVSDACEQADGLVREAVAIVCETMPELLRDLRAEERGNMAIDLDCLARALVAAAQVCASLAAVVRGGGLGSEEEVDE